ncbi:2-hydroxyacyl-CoA dehydratase family protein [Spongiibacter taiwanensis]|uniref:2-hydroxyacyl-CoA dehydratase subunit D n=1 Tax=Spongiibacter taiwanensis TaxID=1748242 RepID=UPI002035FB4B|nr:2-hydroxyacyl-CoA dehydratase family protein [Spongiibacter taiwanensis]USA42005.1 2-hydroxyacyl-CoA dehydratase family protein [Spongiibacter taiwanensis]
MNDSDSSTLDRLREIANNPAHYIDDWKSRKKTAVIGIFPMNFPVEIIAATGALPVIIQDDPTPITAGNNLLAEFYCGYTRSIADQVATGRFEKYDAFMNADHCIQLLGATDVVREMLSDKPFFFEHLIAAMDDSWTHDQVREKIDAFIAEAERVTGQPISDDKLRECIAANNRNRQLLRKIFQARQQGDDRFSAEELQVLIKSSMIMDKEEHSTLLEQLLATSAPRPRTSGIRLHLSGHFCHAPRPELFDVLADCGAVIVDDDLYTGARYVSTDVAQDISPRDALANWYFARNANAPCPTRVQKSVSWSEYLLHSLEESDAEGVIVLMAKFCEAHMFHYPELRKALNAKGIPHLLIETEHEGLPVESVRTRVEAMIERIRRKQPQQSLQEHTP